MMKIEEGDRVEVLGREDGFLGSYWEAIVVRRVSKNKFLVEYTTLKCDEDDESPAYREEVDVQDIRPYPPLIKAHQYDVLDKIDAFDRDGWWVGRVVGRTFAGDYSVYFDSSGDEIDYPFCNLRVHQDWEDGRWVVSQPNKARRAR